MILLAVLVTFSASAAYLDLAGIDRRSRALALCYWTTAASFAVNGELHLASAWPSSLALQAVVALRPEAFFSAALWQFARDFPSITHFGLFDRLAVLGLRIGLIVAVGLFTANLIPFLAPGSWLSRWVGAFERLRNFGPVFWFLVFGVAIPAILAIAWRGRAADRKEQARVRMFLYCIALAFGPVTIQSTLEILFPAYARLFRTSSGFPIAGLIVYPALFGLPIATAYAVTADDVLEVRVLIQRSLRYVLTRWVLMWGALVPLGFLLTLLYRHADQPLDSILATPRGQFLLWCAATGTVILIFRNQLVRALDRWALPGIEAPSGVLAQMTERMKQARTPLEVGSVFCDSVQRALQASAEAYLPVNGRLLPVSGQLETPRESLIPVLLEGSREPCVMPARYRGSYYLLMTENDRRWIDHHQVEVLIPILGGRHKAGLLGIVALKSRQNALAFSPDDLRFLKAAAAASSLACDVIMSEGHAQHESGTDVEELAAQCSSCSRVQLWRMDQRTCTCGGRLEKAVLPKQLLSRFEVHERLGAGGMGVVYRATDRTVDREVAVKTLPWLSEDAADRLMLEARTMAGLSHSDVAVLFGAELWRGTPVLFMEYLSGGTLFARLRSGPIAPRDVVTLGRRLASALVRVHRAGLYHGDIKPSNIGFTHDGDPKLLDFGLARAVMVSSAHAASPDHVRHDPPWGTPAYLSPEVWGGAFPGPTLDLWALAVVLCECLLGKHPWPKACTRDEVVGGIGGALAALQQKVQPPLWAIMAKALSAQAGERWTSAAEIEDALSTAAESV
jgi:hypothetical protein